MKLPKAIETLKVNTMACWWPNGPCPGKQGTDWLGIFAEVRTLRRDIMRRQDIPADAMFFVMDADDPETALYNELGMAMLAVRNAMQNTSSALRHEEKS